MNANILYKIDNLQQFIQFEQINDLYQINLLFAPFLINFNLSPYQGEIQNPTIKVSTLPPKDEHIWYKYTFSSLEDIVMYLKYEDKLYFYFYIQKFKTEYHQKLKTLIFHSLITSCILRKNNLLLIQGVLLNNGDVICADSMGGKSTLAYRINYNNKNLKAICDDGILLDIEKRLAYPLPYFWGYEKGFNYFTNKIININKPIQIKRMFILRQDNKEYIKEVDEQLDIYNLILMFYSFPFQFRNKAREFQKWIDFRKQLFQQVQLDSKNKCDKISELKFLKLVTSTSRITKRFEILEDKI